MKEALMEIHKEAYIFSKPLKIGLEKVKDTKDCELISHFGFLESFECDLCGELMTAFEGQSFSCKECDNIIKLKEPKPYYDFNFPFLINLLKQDVIKKIADVAVLFQDTVIKKTGELLACNDVLKIDFYFFKHEKDFIKFNKKDTICIIFSPFTCEANEDDSLNFFIDIYQILDFNTKLNKIEINEDMSFYLISTIIYKALVKYNKSYNINSSTSLIKSALEFYSLSIVHSQELKKYKNTGGIEMFKQDAKKAIRHTNKEDLNDNWLKIIKPKLVNL